jgi:hypothetical protein
MSTERIRELNDEFRMKGSGHGRVFATAGVHALGALAVLEVLYQVAHFSDFTDNNDPHNEHDFGSFDYKDKKIFWKIDYYDRDCVNGSENPADPSITTRVLTIMLPEEY